jgi:membrane protease YdiL (CAAX protease family)
MTAAPSSRMRTVSAGATPVRRSSTALPAIAILLAAIFTAFAFAWLNSRYADWVTGALQLETGFSRGVAFSAFPLVVGLGIALIRPRAFGLAIGSTLARGRAILGVALGLSAFAAVSLMALSGNPFRDANLFIQGVAVPVSEELVFRGVFFGLILLALGRFYPLALAMPLAIVISAVGFGLAHLNNIGSYDTVFVVLQAGYATVLGLGTGYLRSVTGSVYPAIVVHAAVNVVATLI